MGRTSKRVKPPFSKNLVARRKALGLSGPKLAKAAGLKYPTYRDIEAGYSGGLMANRESIANALGCSLADLYEESSETKSEAIVTKRKVKDSPETIADMTPAELEALVERASRRDSTINIEVARLRKENEILQAKLKEIPEVLLKTWPGADKPMQAVCKFLLSDDPKYYEEAPRALWVKVGERLRQLGHGKTPKSHASKLKE